MGKYKLFDAFITSAGFGTSLFLFLPLVVYLLNPGSVSTPKMTILLCGALIVAIFSVVLTLLSLLPKVGRSVSVASQVGLLAVVILTAFPNKTGELTGFSNILPSENYLLPIVKIFAVLGAGIWIAWRKPDILLQLSRYALIVVIVITGYVAVGRLSAADWAELTTSYKAIRGGVVPSDNFTKLGLTKNVIVVIFDCFTGYRMSEILKEFPKIRNDLSGFIYYPNAIASAISTPAGSSAIITGDLKVSLSDAELEVRNMDSLKNSFLADAQGLGFSVGLISHLGSSRVNIPSVSEKSFFNQKYLTLYNRLPAYMGFLITSLTRIAPGAIIKVSNMYVKFVSTGINRVAVSDWDLLQSLQSEMDRRPQTSKMALNHFIENLHLTNGKGSVIVLHSMLTHPPYRLTRDGKYHLETEQKDKGEFGYETSLYATMQLARLCDKLRSLGVYDSTLIIATADHGTIPLKDNTMGGVLKHSVPDSLNFNPLLMVKAPKTTGLCRDSAMTVWLGDISATVRDFLGLRDNKKSMFASYSLLKPEIPQRKLNIPIFYRPDQVDHYSPLSKWSRQNVEGTFKAKVKLFSGVDQYNTEVGKKGWGAKGIHKRATIEANGRLVAKLNTPGIIVITEGKEGYETKYFFDIITGAEYIKKIPPYRDSLAVGLNVPADIASKLFTEFSGFAGQKGSVGFVAVSGHSYGQMPKMLAGTNDISLEFDWKR